MVGEDHADHHARLCNWTAFSIVIVPDLVDRFLEFLLGPFWNLPAHPPGHSPGPSLGSLLDPLLDALLDVFLDSLLDSLLDPFLYTLLALLDLLRVQSRHAPGMRLQFRSNLQSGVLLPIDTLNSYLVPPLVS